MAKNFKRPNIETHISEREERIDALWDEVQTFAAEHGVSPHEHASCYSCNGDYTAGLAPLTGERCIQCYGESKGILLLDVAYFRGKTIAESKARPHYVFDDNDGGFDNAVRLLEDRS